MKKTITLWGLIKKLRFTNEKIENFLKEIGFSVEDIRRFMSSSTLDASLSKEEYQKKCSLASPVYISTKIDLTPLTALLEKKIHINEELKSLFPKKVVKNTVPKWS
jgi:DNA-binding transcriptional MerR regulator